jgi:MFS family permease
MVSSNAISILLTPLFSKLSDSMGRTPLIILGSLGVGLARVLIVANANIVTLCCYYNLSVVSTSIRTVMTDASLADLYKGDPTLLGTMKGRILSTMMASGIVAPLLGSSLVSRFGLKGPYKAGIVLATINIAYQLSPIGLIETVQKEPSQACGAESLGVSSSTLRSTLAKLDPLTPMMRLLSISDRMRNLGVISMLRAIAHPGPMYLVTSLHQTNSLNWNLVTRSRYLSLKALLSLPGIAFVGPALRNFGISNSIRLGVAASTLQNILMARCTKLSHFIALTPLGWLETAASAAVSASICTEAEVHGMAQGELQGTIGNLNAVAMMVAPMLWGTIYARGVSAGQPGLFYYFVAVLTLLQLGGVSSETKAAGRANRPKKLQQDADGLGAQATGSCEKRC